MTRWAAPLAVSHFRLLWRMVLGDVPLPTAVAVDPGGHPGAVVTKAEYERSAIHQLVAGGYLAGEPPYPAPTRAVIRLLRVLAGPDFEVRARITVAGKVVRAVTGAQPSQRAVLVEVHGDHVWLSEVETLSPAVAAASLLPAMPPGRLNLTVPTSSLEHAVAEFHAADAVSERDRFVAALLPYVAPADAVDLFRIARSDGWLDASFAASRAAHDGAYAVTVRGAREFGCHVLSRRDHRTVVEPADAAIVVRRITELLRSAGAG